MGKRLSGSLVIAIIDPGEAKANRVAVATTKRISSKPSKFQRKRTSRLAFRSVDKKIATKRAVTATVMSPHPPGTANA